MSTAGGMKRGDTITTTPTLMTKLRRGRASQYQRNALHRVCPSQGKGKDAPKSVRERDTDLVGERAVDDGKVGAEPVQDAAARRRVKVAERRVDDAGQARLEE